MRTPRAAFVGFAAVVALLLLSPSAPPVLAGCGGYGNCLTSTIAYDRSNPDGSLYLGDSFTVTPSVVFGPNTTSVVYSWSYDASVLQPAGPGAFEVIANVSGSYHVTVTAEFAMREVVKNSSVVVYSALATTQTVQLRAFVLVLHTVMGNATDSQGRTLRNPDGSFFHGDEFFANYTYSFLFMHQRPDIKVTVEPPSVPSFVKLTAYQNSTSTGYFLFTVANSTGTSKITVTASAFNFQSALLGSKTQTQKFAVVDYAPHFTYFTYMEYNSRNASAYDRPFVTLVRYGGNDPGYSYKGDANTAPITAVNDTRERALINSFDFSTVEYGVKYDPSSVGIGADLSFWHSSADLGTRTTNHTSPILTFEHRVVRYYFTSSAADIARYTEGGAEYFNVTESASSKGFAGGNYALFNTSYLYQPVNYSGYVTIKVFGSGEPNVTMLTPDPVNPHLIAAVVARFGHDPSVVGAFEKDLWSSDSPLMHLIPVSSSPGTGTWVFLVNDTNRASTNSTAIPLLEISVGDWSYSVPVAFSSFTIDRTLVPSLPFAQVDGYYLDPLRSLVALPLNHTLAAANPFVEWDYVNDTFVSPVTPEPGGLSHYYGFIFGSNSTVYAAPEGGGGKLLDVHDYSTSFRGVVEVGPPTGGATSIWVKDPSGKVVFNETLPQTTSPPAPPGYFGFYPLALSMTVNGTYVFGMSNSWGASGAFATYSNVVRAPSPPVDQVYLETLLASLFFGLVGLGWVAAWRRSSSRA